MLTDYENEQNELNKIIETDTADMQRIIGGQNNVECFLKLVKKYENITEFTPAMINEFIDKILVHEPQGKGATLCAWVQGMQYPCAGQGRQPCPVKWRFAT